MRRGMMALAAGAMAMVMAWGVRAPVVSAELSEAAIQPLAWASSDGATVTVSGWIVCTAGETYEVEATAGQDQPWSQGRGRSLGLCTGDAQVWSVALRGLNEGASFTSGEALACWQGETWAGEVALGQMRTGFQQGCVPIQIVAPAAPSPATD